MAKALRIARRGQGRVSPNPMVGAVLVAGENEVGSGWHEKAGEMHAEIAALDEAGDRARGATLFVTLEPCSHYGRTPACAEAVIQAGVSEVFVAMTDPDSRVAGKGIKALRNAGIGVHLGLGEIEARRLNEAYIVHRTKQRPFVTYKAAATIDGRTSASDGSSKWITGPPARRDVQRLRARSDAICVGIGTLIEDDPSLTVRQGKLMKQPLRIVVDSGARTPLNAAIFAGGGPVLVATSAGAVNANVSALRSAGAEVLSTSGHAGVSLHELLAFLGKRSIVSLLVEGGPTLAGSFADQGLIDKYIFYIAPKLMGRGGKGMFEGWSVPSVDRAAKLTIESVRRLGDDLRIEAYPAGSPLPADPLSQGDGAYIESHGALSVKLAPTGY